MSKEKLHWKTEKRKVDNLIPYEQNPRQMTEKQVKDLTKSLEKFGLVEIPAIDTDNKIVAGHQRLKIMQLVGRGSEMIDVRVPSRKLTKKEFEEYNLRSNKNVGEWNFDVLANFDLDLLKEVGFEHNDLDRLLDDVTEDEFDAEKEYEKIKTPTSKRGDVFQLGKHRLMCGSSESSDDFEKLMGGVQAQLIFTDPPYSVDYHSTKGNSYSKGKYAKGKKGEKIFNDDKGDAEALSFYKNVLLVLDKFSKKDCVLYWWFANQKNWLNRLAWIETGWRQSQIIIWVKNGIIFSPGQIYHRCYEPCMVGWKVKGTHYHNKKIANLKDVFNLDYDTFSEQLDVWFEKRDNTSQYVHPTQKPVRLAERALRKNSKPHDAVIDAFGGSGSTLIACEQLGRSAYLMELDPKYCDVIIKRWETFTSKKAQKL